MPKLIRVCIPSYRRPRVRTLEAYPFCAVYVDASDEQAYRELHPDTEIIVCPDGIQGNVARVRNYILGNEFGNGADAVVLMDDDISYMGRFETKLGNERGYDYHRLDEDGLRQLVAQGAQLCEDLGYRMFGVNLTPQPVSYRRSVPFNTNKFCGGPFQGFLKNPLRYDESLPLKEDYDMTIQQCRKYGGVLRMNFAYPMAEQAGKGQACSGGCSTMRNTIREREQFERLQRKWGGQIVRKDKGSKRGLDYNPIIKIPINGL